MNVEVIFPSYLTRFCHGYKTFHRNSIGHAERWLLRTWILYCLPFPSSSWTLSSSPIEIKLFPKTHQVSWQLPGSETGISLNSSGISGNQLPHWRSKFVLYVKHFKVKTTIWFMIELCKYNGRFSASSFYLQSVAKFPQETFEGLKWIFQSSI